MRIRIGKNSYTPSQIRKFAVSLATALVILITSALDTFTRFIPHGVAGVIVSIVAFIGAVVVFLVKNAKLLDALDNIGAADGADETGRHAAP